MTALACGLLINGCSSADDPEEQLQQTTAGSKQQEQTTYAGDLDNLKQKGKLRILVPANIGGDRYLPRKGSPVEYQQEAAESFALSQGLQPELVPIEHFSQMIPALTAGQGDIIVANLTVTDQRREQIAFSVPLTQVQEQVLVRATDTSVKKPRDLAGKKIMADPGSSFWPRLLALQKKHPTISLLERPTGMSDEDELDALSRGEVDALVRDSNIAEMYLAYRDDLKIAFNLKGNRNIAWGIRKDAPQLRSALNEFLHLQLLSDTDNAVHKDDLPGIKKRKVLRVLLRNNAASYFLYKGELLGFEYELAKAFAKANKLRLEVIVPDTHAQLLDWLNQGYGDMAVGFLEPLDSLKSKVAFSRPYHFAPRHLITRSDDHISTTSQLQGRTVSVRQSSPYWQELQALKATGVDFNLQAADEDMETEELIRQVASGKLDTTVADGHLMDIELAQGSEVKSALILGKERAHAVAVRPQNKQLLDALNRFIKKQYKGLVYNVLYKKYFKNPRKIRDLAKGRVSASGKHTLSPYDKLTRKYADQYGFDWRLVTAQMYQESRFDPKAKSFAGARGLLQVMPKTARSMGFSDLDKPEKGIHAGVKYLDWVRDRFETRLPFSERMWFTLAAYNAGSGHVQDARRLAKEKGWDPDRWFGHTEQAMLLLSKKQYAKKARHGYVRGSEPVKYVRNIKQRFQAYAQLTGDKIAQLDEPALAPAD